MCVVPYESVQFRRHVGAHRTQMSTKNTHILPTAYCLYRTRLIMKSCFARRSLIVDINCSGADNMYVRNGRAISVRVVRAQFYVNLIPATGAHTMKAKR